MNGNLIDLLEALEGGDAGAVGLGAVVGGRGTMAGRIFGFELQRPCPSSLFWPSMIALGMLDHHARRSNMVYQDLVHLRLGSSAMDYNFCMGPFSGSRELDISHRSLDVGS